MAATSSTMDSDGGATFNKHLLETERSFKQMTLKNDTLDGKIARLRNELEHKQNELHEDYKIILSLDEEIEAEKTILLSLRNTVRQEMEKGETLKRTIEEGNQQVEHWQCKERENIEKFEEDSARIVEKAQENNKIDTQEIINKVNSMKQKIKASQEEKHQLRKRVEELKAQLNRNQQNSEWEGLDQVYNEVKNIPKEILETEQSEEKHLMSILQTLMSYCNKRKRHLQSIKDA